MSAKSNDFGRAYEFAFLNALFNELSKFTRVEILENSSLNVARNAWEKMELSVKNTYKISVKSGVELLFDLEPILLESKILKVYIQSDKVVELGDVRDIVVANDEIKWQIGFSLKHNHFAVKHSRLSPQINLGAKWYAIPCGNKYFSAILPIFERLLVLKGKNWSEIKDKQESVYRPLLCAFRDEILRSYAKNPKMLKSFIFYLLGKFDFYKVISIDNEKITRFESFNLNGTLNKNGKFYKRKIEIPLVILPNKIAKFDFKEGSNNTLELYLNEGWQFNFRIHNASSKIENSLKFDIQIIGAPVSIASINTKWKI